MEKVSEGDQATPQVRGNDVLLWVEQLVSTPHEGHQKPTSRNCSIQGSLWG